MKLLPLFIRFRMCHKAWVMPTVWLPVVLLWPFVFLLLVPLFLLGLVAIVLLDNRSVSRFFQLCSGTYGAICELRGTRVEVEDRENRIFIAIT